MSERLSADREVVFDSLARTFGNVPGLLSICSDTDKWTGRRFTTDQAGIEAATDYVMRLDAQGAQGIYHQVTTLREKPTTGRGGEDLAHAVSYLWADGDYGTAGHKPGPDDLPHPPDAAAVEKIVNDAGLPHPTGWIHTGGGLNPMWLLDAPYVIADDADRERLKEITTGLQAILGAAAYRHGFTWDVGVGNLDRLMRQVGTVNRKEDCGARPTSAAAGTGELFTLASLAEAIERLAPPARQAMERAAGEKRDRKAARLGTPRMPPRSAPATPRISGNGPFDVIADLMRFRDILEPAGFTFQGYHSDGREKYLRPAGAAGPASSAYSLLCDDHVAINWSERSDLPVGALPPGAKLTRGTLYAHLNYYGDVSAAAKDIMRAAAGLTAGPAAQLPPFVLAEVKRRCLQTGTPLPVASPEGAAFAAPDEPQDWSDTEEGGQAAEPVDRFPRLDWYAAFATDFTQIDWLAGRFMERGQQVAVVGDGKVGKTLLVHDWLFRAVTGRTFLGDDRRTPIKVLYFDRENSLRDIVTRMQAFGATPEDLAHFDYRMFPKFSGGLDEADVAVLELMRIVQDTRPDLVVLDTVSRFIAGKEDKADTWLQFYRRIHAPLKAAGVACVRLDHMGKDAERGSRGSSAKSQDVDHVWELTRTDEKTTTEGDCEVVATSIRMKRTHTRTGIGRDVINIVRRGVKGPDERWMDGQTRHELADPRAVRQQEQEIQLWVDQLLMAGAPKGMGRDKLKDWALGKGIVLPGNTTTLSQIVREVKTRQGA